MRKVLVCFCLLAVPLLAQTAPPSGQLLFQGRALEALQFGGEDGTGGMDRAPVQGQEFNECLKLTTSKVTSNPWDVQVYARVPEALKNGDVLLAEFWARAVDTNVESGEAKSEFVLQRASDPFTNAVTYGLSMGCAWKKYSIPFTAVEDSAPGESQVCFRMGYHAQSFELAGLRLTNYRDQARLEDLPATLMTYGGMEEDAPWRQAARERIEKLRKGDLTVQVTDGQGRPVPDARVSMRMKRHAFTFGTEVPASFFRSGD